MSLAKLAVREVPIVDSGATDKPSLFAEMGDSFQRGQIALDHHSRELFVVNHVPPSEFLQGDAVIAEPVSEASVLGLLFRSGPSDVPGLIVPVDIDSVERMFDGRPWANMAQEGCEVVAPFGAHGNSTAAIDTIFVVGWAETATLGSLPCSMFWRVTGSMSDGPFAKKVDGIAATTDGQSSAQWFRSNIVKAAAIADARPHRSSAIVPDTLYYHQTPESLSGEVKQSHGSSYRMLSTYATRAN